MATIRFIVKSDTHPTFGTQYWTGGRASVFAEDAKLYTSMYYAIRASRRANRFYGPLGYAFKIVKLNGGEI